jgi:peptide/nickel transport system ATP-binding protein
MTATPLVEIDGLSVAYGSRWARHTVLDGIDLRIGQGEVVGLIGETGSGKTTLARSILGLSQVVSGSITVDGTSITGLTGRRLREFRRLGTVQYVFQDPLQSLDPDVTVRASLTESLRIRGVRDAATLESAATTAVAKVGLPENLLDRLPGRLSGGQRQRVVIARALVTEPKLLICDEPVSALDASNRILMLDLFARLRTELGISQLFISHDLGSVAGISDRILVLNGGRLVDDGPTERVLREPEHPYTRHLVSSAPRLPSAR